MSLMYSYDVAGYNLDSYPRAGVPRGTMSEKKTMASKIYPNMTANHWVYASPGVDPSRPSPVMVWQDGESMTGARGSCQDAAGDRGGKPGPSKVDSAHDPRAGLSWYRTGRGRRRPSRHARSAIRRDLRPIWALSTGGDTAGGGEDLPAAPGRLFARDRRSVRRRDLRVQHGLVLPRPVQPRLFPCRRFHRSLSAVQRRRATEATSTRSKSAANLARTSAYGSRAEPTTTRIQGGSFPLQNILLANSLKLQGYDFHFRFGEAMHSGGQPSLDLPEILAWLWREYDPAKTHQEYQMEEAEKSKPVFRVKIANRDSW